ncbi:hypothetical protein SFC65_19675 [Priestia filamentosa]|uniref:hypothetical protein n=1 Tax=Priestia filamentosa TaxID=1402861 RepID=UPI0039820BF9
MSIDSLEIPLTISIIISLLCLLTTIVGLYYAFSKKFDDGLFDPLLEEFNFVSILYNALTGD